jgi:hypothetical protein
VGGGLLEKEGLLEREGGLNEKGVYSVIIHKTLDGLFEGGGLQRGNTILREALIGLTG